MVTATSDNSETTASNQPDPTADDLQQRLSALSPEKLQLLSRWLAEKDGAALPEPAALVRLPRVGERPSFPLSFGQQRLWFLDQLEPGNPAYNAAAGVRLRGALDQAALERSLNEIVRRHEILRTTFVAEAGQPRQVIAPNLSLLLPVTDLRGRPEAERETEAQRLILAEAQQPFDLARGPLLRATLLRLADDEHWLILTLHHIITDGWSASVIFREIALIYSAFCAGQPSPLPELPLQFADFATWQRERLQGAIGEKHAAYWRKQLAELPVLELPADHPRPALQSFRGATWPITFSPELHQKLKALTTRAGVTLFTTLLAAFQALLAHDTGQTDIVVGTPIANRNRAELEGLIGFFSNTLVIRTRLDGRPSFIELLQRVRQTLAEASAYQEMPFEQLLPALQLPRDLSRSPLFQVMFSVMQFLPDQDPDFGGLELTHLPIDNHTAKFDLALYVLEAPEILNGSFEYNTDLFDSETIAQEAERFSALLDNIVSNPDQKLDVLLALTPAERHALLRKWNPNPAEYPTARCLPELFEAQVERTPNAIAVIFENQRLTYAELNARANQLAQHLRTVGVGPDVLVGVCLERSLEMVVSLLAILKAGGAYVPLDPAYPEERIAYMLADARIEVLLTQSWLLAAGRGSLAGNNQPMTICLDTDWETITSNQRPATSDQRPTPDNLAYVIYTSGSTGRPKGSLVTHANVTRLFDATQAWYHFTDADVWTFFHSYAFDFSVWEMWGALLYGGRLVIVPHWVSRSPEDFYNLLVAEQVTVLNQTPSAFRQLSQAEESLGVSPALHLRLVIFGGEALELSHLRSWFERHGDAQPELVNMYGITETTVHVTYRPVRISDLSAGSVIGLPIPDLQIYVLNHELQPVPPGVTGELYVGGAGLARGYLGKPELTAERFVPNPFAATVDEGRKTKDEGKDIRPSSLVIGPSSRLYRTGDLVRFLRSGELEYLGRSDQQVKLRGFRIELGEIEARLNQHPQVRASVVVVVERTPGEKVLAAYVILREGKPSAAELRSYLQVALPEYMLPAAFVFLEALPLTSNGKLDRRALPAPEWGRLAAPETYRAPRTPTEEMLAGIWAALLGLERVGTQDNFFEIGGHSLLATQVLSRLREAFGVNLPLRALFEAPTIARLAERVEAARRAEPSFKEIPLQPAPRAADSALQLSFAQQRLWLLDQLEPGSPAYNIPIVVRLRGPLKISLLEQSLNEILRRHEALRTIFVSHAGRPAQVILPTVTLSLSVLPLDELAAAEREAEIHRRALAEAQRSFDLAAGPLLRASLLPVSENEHVLLLTFHHIIFDGWSIGVFLREIAALYGAYQQGHASPLAELPIQYADFVYWQREWLQGETLEGHLSYWRSQLADAPALELTTDHARPAAQSYRGATYGFNLPQSLTQRLRFFSDQNGVTLFMTLLAAFQTLLARHTGQEDIVVGSPIANRTRPELEGLLGFFVNTLVLRTDLSGNPSFTELLRRVREVALEAYAHQELPFEQLVDALGLERDLSRTPLFQVWLVLQNTPLPALEFAGLTLSPILVDNRTSKFDLSLYLTETETGLSAAFEYSTDLFDRATIVRLAEHFQMLLASAVANPAVRLSELSLIMDAERNQILGTWETTGAPDSREQSLPELFEAQAARTPTAIAVVHETETLTYQELNQRANQLTHYLRAHGVGSETPVALCVERSAEMVIGLLAILKAGGAYVPLDPAYPPERLAYMLEDSQAKVLITQSHLMERLSGVSVQVSSEQPSAIGHLPSAICLDTDWPSISQSAISNPQSAISPDNLAYIIYTSGSTGQPKGVLGTHRGALNRFAWMWGKYPFTEGEVCCQKTALSFVDAVWEVFGPLLAGVPVVIIPDEAVTDPVELVTRLADAKVTRLVLVPSLLRMILDTYPDLSKRLPQLRYWVSSGEALPAELARRFHEALPGAVLLNLYGSSEVAADVTWHETRAGFTTASVPIGRPIANTQIYLLDRYLQPVPIGVPGELYVGGAGVARGYYGRPELTAERFIPNPFAQIEDEGRKTKDEGIGVPSSSVLRLSSRLYRTGDLARYLADGTIEYLGRADHQVKVRGFRIELGEIEAALEQHPAVHQVAVVAREVVAGEGPRLVAYIVPTEDGGRWTDDGRETSTVHRPPSIVLSPTELRAFLKTRLPEYMVPALFMFLETLPLTPSGKLNRRALPAPEGDRPELAAEYVAPRTAAEETLAAIWKKVLGIERVGVHDNFFELGGDSILSIQVIAQARQAGLQLTPKQLFQHQTVAELAAVAGTVQVTADQVATPPPPFSLAGLDQSALDALIAGDPEVEDLYPASPMQAGMLFHSLYAPESGVYLRQFSCRINRGLDVPQFKRAWEQVTERQSILRTAFRWERLPKPLQMVWRRVSLPWEEKDWRAMPPAEQEQRLQALLRADRERGFDLSRAPLMRLVLIRVADDAYYFVWTHLHLLLDGWSVPLLLKEVFSCYEQLTSPLEAAPKDAVEEQAAQPVHTYVEYIAWLEKQDLAQAEAFWRQWLQGFSAPTPLGVDRILAPEGQNYIEHFIQLPSATTTELQALARRHQVTLGTLVQGAWALLLSRYSGEIDVLFGATVSGRPPDLPGVESIIGLFINTLPVRVQIEPQARLMDWLRDLQARQAELRQYEYSPLVQVQSWSAVPRGLSLFESLLVFENFPQDATLLQQSGKLEINQVGAQQQANYPITVMGFPGAELTLGIGYDTRRFDAPTIERMLNHLRTLLEGMLAAPEQRLAELPMLTEAERQQVLVEWNARIAPPPDQCLHELFEAQVQRTPQAVAVIEVGAGAVVGATGRSPQMTYQELNEQANRLARHLQSLGVGPEVRVGVCLERSLQTIVSLLAILKAGGVYIPLDPSYPQAHLTFIMDETRLRVLITRSELLERLPVANGKSEVVCLDSDWETITASGQPPATNNQPPTPDSLAYIVYTSGSTGQPKGVAVAQRQLLNRFDWMWQDYPFEGDEVLCQRTTVNFSVSLWELLGGLFKGVPTVIVPDDVVKDVPRLVETLDEYRITRLVVVPSLLRAMLDSGVDLSRYLSRLKLISVCGEVFSPELVRRFRAQLPNAALINQYGASEANDVSHYNAQQLPDDATSVPIGRPIRHMQFYILDENFQPVPVGVTGQVYVANPGLARGYLNRPDLTAERFVPNPFVTTEDEGPLRGTKDEDSFLRPSSSVLRLYNMGDLARYLPDGTIELLGRRDHQVKLRGMRVELPGVELVLRQHPAVTQAVVVVHEDSSGDGAYALSGSDKRLIAYVVPQPDHSPTINDLREYLKEKLPEFMVPATFVFLEKMPLTPNGKVDRKSLPKPDRARPEIGETFVAPRTPLETTIANVWAEILGVDQVGIYDSFFELGGHSLMATQLISRLQATVGELPMRLLFEAPTVANLAAAIAEEKVEQVESVPLPVVVPDPARRYEPFPMTEIQQAYWIGRMAAFELGNVGTHLYLELESEQLDLERFNWAWQQLIERHDMLRMIVHPDGQQQILEHVPFYRIEVLDLRERWDVERETELAAIRERMSREAFPTDRWPLFEIRASRLEGQRLRLHLKLDLILADAWSTVLIGQELAQFYTRPETKLPPLELTFRDYVLTERSLHDSELYQRSRDYWWKRLETLPPAPDLPLAKDPRSIAQPRFVRRSAQLAAESWKRLQARAQQAGLTRSGILLAAFAEMLTLWSKSPRFTINLTLFNRLPLHPQVAQVVGDFTSLNLLAVDNSTPDAFEARARRLQQQLWDDLDHRYVGGVRVMRELMRREGGSPRAAMPVVFTSMLVQNLDDPDNPDAQRFELPLHPVHSAGQTPQVWLDHQIDEIGGVLSFNWDSVDELFPEGMLDAMFETYVAFLHRLVDDEACWQETSPCLLPATQLEARLAANETQAPIPSGLLHTLFAAQVPQRPDQPAVIASGRTLSYRELAQRSAHLGRQLRDLGARPNTLVAVVMQKGWEQVVGVLSILQAGAAYLPLSADLPQERLWYLLEHGQVEFVLTQSWLDQALTWPENVRRLCVDTDAEVATPEGQTLKVSPAPSAGEAQHQVGETFRVLDFLEPIQQPTDLAYVIYTSGSTGLPKGVMIDHRGAVNTIVDLNQRFHIGPEDRVLALSSLSFDLSVYDIFGVLAAGGTIVMPNASATREPAHWAELVAREKVTLWNSVPALMELFVEYAARHPEISARSLRLVWMSGDWIPITLPDQISSLLPDAQIISMGGATEASIWSILYPIDYVDPTWKSIPYGQPMVNQTFYVLNESLEPCPVWVPGQLYIGGIGVAQGYWRDEEKTRDRFIPDPFVERTKDQGPRTNDERLRTDDERLFQATMDGNNDLRPSSFVFRLYKTGDLGRYLPDGNIEFLGREDFQVKIRGYRIELGEIETALGQHPAVRLAAVNAVGEPRGNKRLVAYLVLNQAELSVNELRSYLRDKLPEYMIPTHFMFLESLPLSSNGKVDRKALPDPAQAVTTTVEEAHAELPASALQIAKLVASVLKLDHIDPAANLLDLGANSVDMIRVVNQLEIELAFRPRIDEFYQSPTIASLARAYERQRSEKEAASTHEQSEMARAAELLKKVRQLSPEEVKALLEANRT